MNRNISEEELIRLAKSQTKEGFDVLYENYSSVLYGVVCRTIDNTSTAEDILQEIFVKIWRGIDKYDPGKGKLFTWMIRIARNTCIDHIRSQDFRHNQLIKTDEYGARHIPEVKVREHDWALEKMVTKLDPKHSAVIQCIYYGHNTYEEAAKELGIPIGTLKTRVRTALLLLRSSLQMTELNVPY